MLPALVALGIMTGNSLDAADMVATRFSEDGTQTDLISYSVPFPPDLKSGLRWLRQKIAEAKGDVGQVAAQFAKGRSTEPFNFDQVSDAYIEIIADGVQELVSRAKARSPDFAVDLIGLHGQTCAHCTPSNIKTGDPRDVYTVQLGDGGRLADLVGLPVVYDFRSDDMFNGGESAPLAPIHHRHLARQIRQQGVFPIAFANGGNTGNITVISEQDGTAEVASKGWDTGPFNNFPDKLAQLERRLDCDVDGAIGATGRVSIELLAALFHQAVITKNGENYLLKSPPKSSDPEWYRLLPELTGDAPVNGAPLPFEDRLRTAEYFSAYIFFHTLQFVPLGLRMPSNFAICGGGWKNAVVLDHFRGLVQGEFSANPVLPEHREAFSRIQKRIEAGGRSGRVEHSQQFGFDGAFMEARIFADAAVCRITGEPFSIPDTTGVSKPTVGGLIRYPGGDAARTGASLRQWIAYYKTESATMDRPDLFDGRWSRAAAGWYARLNGGKP